MSCDSVRVILITGTQLKAPQNVMLIWFCARRSNKFEIPSRKGKYVVISSRMGNFIRIFVQLSSTLFTRLRFENEKINAVKLVNVWISRDNWRCNERFGIWFGNIHSNVGNISKRCFWMIQLSTIYKKLIRSFANDYYVFRTNHSRTVLWKLWKSYLMWRNIFSSANDL